MGHRKHHYNFSDFKNDIGLSKGNLQIAGRNLKKLDSSLKPVGGSLINASSSGINGISGLFNSTTHLGSTMETSLGNLSYPIIILGVGVGAYILLSNNNKVMSRY